MTGMTGLDGELDYSKMVHWVLSALSYGKTTGDAPWRGVQYSCFEKLAKELPTYRPFPDLPDA